MKRFPDHILDLVRRMAQNPDSPKGLREFHQKQLADMLARNEIKSRSAPPAFGRFLEKLSLE